MTALPISITTANQLRTFGPKVYTENGETYRIRATARYDDRCGNGHNTFSLTGDIDRKEGNRWVEYAGGCIHDDIIKHFPELAELTKWHLCGSNGPMHYVANTVYQAGDRDCYGLRKGEFRQYIDRETGLPLWKLGGAPSYRERTIPALEQPAPIILEWEAYGRVGEGKPRQLDLARSSAIWPDATDEELSVEPEELKRKLLDRLPALMVQFKLAMEGLGFTY